MLPRRFALACLLTVTACTSGGSPQAGSSSAPPSPTLSPSPAAPPSTTPSPVDELSPTPEQPYRPLAANALLSGFVATSASFVSAGTGWFFGTQECGTATCGVLLQTRDTGRTFVRRQAPPMLVANVRFADLDEGWAFGDLFDSQVDPGLWRTHDGGRSWHQVLDRPVPSLEVGSGSVWAVVLDKSRTSPQLFRGSTRTDTLHLIAQIPNRSATVTVGHGTAYVVAQNLGGPIATTLHVATGTRLVERSNPCVSTEARGLAVAAGEAHHLVAACSGEPGTGEQLKNAYASSDDGRTWRRRPDPSAAGYGGAVAATSTRTFLTGGRNGINMEVGSGPWREVLDSEEGIGFRYVGFTDDSHGVALEEQHDAWMTSDAGEHWRRLRFS